VFSLNAYGTGLFYFETVVHLHLDVIVFSRCCAASTGCPEKKEADSVLYLTSHSVVTFVRVPGAVVFLLE